MFFSIEIDLQAMFTKVPLNKRGKSLPPFSTDVFYTYHYLRSLLWKLLLNSALKDPRSNLFICRFQYSCLTWFQLFDRSPTQEIALWCLSVGLIWASYYYSCPPSYMFWECFFPFSRCILGKMLCEWDISVCLWQSTLMVCPWWAQWNSSSKGFLCRERDN